LAQAVVLDGDPAGRGERKGKGGEGKGRGLPSVPIVPNLPLHHWW